MKKPLSSWIDAHSYEKSLCSIIPHSRIDRYEMNISIMI